jgi:flagellar hook-associated protein 3 FlgL
MYYKSIYAENNSQINNKLFDVNKQIASGLKIQYAKDDVRTFAETMRLDNEMTVIGQIKTSAESGYKISNQTDIILNDFQNSMDRMKTLTIQASNAANGDVSLDALALEMRGLEDHLRNLANTSINGQYLFSGSAVHTRPISEDGTYNGNDGELKAFLGSNVQQQYNLPGSELFLGENASNNRIVTSNVPNFNVAAQYPEFAGDPLLGEEKYITVDDTIRDMMGDTDATSTTPNDHYFYLRGTKSDGTSFNDKISMGDDEKVGELLKRIGEAYGNTPTLDVVNVSLNTYGEIVVEDKLKGSSKLDFHMVGAVDFGGTGLADVTQIDALDGAETDFKQVMATGYVPGLFVKEFVVSDYLPANGAASTTDALLYDRTQFAKEGSKLSSNVAQIVKDTNAFASPTTKLSEVAATSLDGKTFNLSGVGISGTPYAVQIDFATAGTTFSLDTDGDGNYDNGTYDIFNMQTPRSAVAADDMTYQQFLDVINMVVTESLPAANTAADYDQAIITSSLSGGTYLSHDGKIEFEQNGVSDTKATLSIYDSNSGDFTAAASVMTFNSNNALAIHDPKTDFFGMIDKIISSVEQYKLYPDSSLSDPRSIGMQDAILMIDDLQNHLSKSHSIVGAQSNALQRALEKTTLLEVSTMSLRSSVIDTDLAEASLTLSQLSLNYEAMLSTIGKVSKLSLVNYL